MTSIESTLWRRGVQLFMAICVMALSACGTNEDSSTPTPAAISAQPSSSSVVTGSAATFSVTAAGDDLAYQWQLSTDGGAVWADIVGAKAATLTVAAPTASMSGYRYRVVINGPNNSVTSSPVTLTVTAAVSAPQVTVQPADQTTTVGTNATFSVTATGTALTYQWQTSPNNVTWTDVSGATTATLNLAAVGTADSGKRVRVVITNSGGNVTSNAAALTVNPAPAAPAITTPPGNASVQVPQAATFSVVATGTPAPSYQWQVSTDGGVNFTDVSAATAASYTTPATTLADDGKRYRVRVQNSQGQLLSAAATLSVAAAAQAPSISAQPVNQSVTEPATATFSVTATGTPSPTFQWQLSTDAGASFANINGATSASYTTSATVAADSGKRLRVLVSNASGTVTSAVATLTVTASGGGGGGGGGGGSAGACTFDGSLATGFTAQVVSSSSAAPSQQITLNLRVNGPAVFQGQSTTEVQSDTTISGVNTITSFKSYSTYNAGAGTVTTYGGVGKTTLSLIGFETITDSTTVYTPPFVSRIPSLTIGQTVTETATQSTTTTTTQNGVPGAPTTSSDSTSSTTTLLGTEIVTVPAGTFDTCKYQITQTGQTEVLTMWRHKTYGLEVKFLAAGVTTSALSIKVNGVPMN